MRIETDGRTSGVWVRHHGRRPAVLSGFTAAQGDKARLLIADDGIAPHGDWDTVWDVVGSDGETKYVCSAGGCNCPAGLHGVRCYHRAAVVILMSGKGINTAARHWRAARKAMAAGDWDKALALREQARAALEFDRRAQ